MLNFGECSRLKKNHEILVNDLESAILGNHLFNGRLDFQGHTVVCFVGDFCLRILPWNSSP